MVQFGRLPLVLLSVFLWMSAEASANSTPSEVQLVEVTPGVFAVLQDHDQRFNDSNSAVIIGEKNIVVVDSQTNPARVSALIREIRRISDLPVGFVINTHWHGDHTDGNRLYRDAFPGVELIAHHSVVHDLVHRATPAREEQIIRYRDWILAAENRLAKGESLDGLALQESDKADLAERIQRARRHLENLQSITTILPTITYENTLTLHLGSRRALLLHAPAHTRGDTVVFLPDDKILITGDLLDEMPFGGHGYPNAWIEALDHLEALDFEKIIPGHGPVFEGKKQLIKIRALLRSVIGQVRASIGQDLSLEQIQATIDLAELRRSLAGDDPVAQRNFDGFIPSLVERVYSEATGQLDPRELDRAP